MKDSKVLEIVQSHELRTLSQINLSDGQFICEKINNEVRSFQRKAKGSPSEPLTENNAKKGYEVFHFASVNIVYRSDKGKVDMKHDVSVPNEFLAAEKGSSFIFIVRNGYANFNDRELTATEVSKLMADIIE